MGAGVVIICILQLSNWFTQKHINKVISLFLLTQIAGYKTPLHYIHPLFDSVGPLIYWIGAVMIILISIVDYYAFAFHPLQKNIFLDQDKD